MATYIFQGKMQQDNFSLTLNSRSPLFSLGRRGRPHPRFSVFNGKNSKKSTAMDFKGILHQYLGAVPLRDFKWTQEENVGIVPILCVMCVYEMNDLFLLFL